jgi:hypothetical protein
VNEKEGRKSGVKNRRSIGDAARPNEDLFSAPDFLPDPVRGKTDENLEQE